MSLTSLLASYIFRDFIVQGDPTSGIKNVDKSDVRTWGTEIEDILVALSSGQAAGVIGYALKSDMTADLAQDDKTVGWVIGDPTDGNDGLYIKSGASGSGSWTASNYDPFTTLNEIATKNKADVQSIVTEILSTISEAGSYGDPSSPAVTGTGTLSVNNFLFGDAIEKPSLVKSVTFQAAASGDVKIRTYSRAGDVFTAKREQTVTAVAGLNEIPLSLILEEGDYLGVLPPAGVLYFTSGTSGDNGGWYNGAGDSFTDSAVVSSSRLNIRFDLDVYTLISKISGLANEAAKDVDLQALKAVTTLVSTETTGKNNIAVTANKTSVGYFVIGSPLKSSGRLKGVNVAAFEAGTVEVMVFDKDGDTFSVVTDSRQTLTVSGSGVSRFDLDYPVTAGQYLGFSSTIVCFTTGQFFPSGYYNGPDSSGGNFTDATVATSLALEINFETEFSASRVGITSATPFTINHIINAGQSLAEGSTTSANGVSPITTEQKFDTVGFPAYPAVPTELLPATTSNLQRTNGVGRGEFPALGMAERFKELLQLEDNVSPEAPGNVFAVSNTAVGGQSILSLKKGTAPYIAGIDRAVLLRNLDNEAGTFGVLWGQGESDKTMDPAVYEQHLIDLASDYDAEIRSETGQNRKVMFFSYQLTGNDDQTRDIGLAQLSASKKSDLIVVVLPMYILEYYDSLHIKALPELIWGAYAARAAYETLKGNKFEPLQSVSTKVSGSQVDIIYNKTGLVLDYTTFSDQGAGGFDIYDGATQISVTSATVINGNTVRLVADQAIPAGATVEIAKGGSVGRSDAYVGGSCNLRDNAGLNQSFNGWDLHNFAVPERIYL